MICLMAFGISQFVSAQQTALTADGKVVILYDDGTWKYADVKDPKLKESKAVSATGTVSAATAPVKNNSPIVLKDGETEKVAFIEGPSKKLSKYFKHKNVVRCDFTLTSKDGKAYLKTDWKIMNGEAYSYFGFIKKGNSLTLELIGGQTINLTYNEEFEPREYEKYGFSTYSAGIDLTDEQMKILRNTIIYKAHMNWSKRTEEYKVIAPSYFIKTLPKILE